MPMAEVWKAYEARMLSYARGARRFCMLSFVAPWCLIVGGELSGAMFYIYPFMLCFFLPVISGGYCVAGYMDASMMDDAAGERRMVWMLRYPIMGFGFYVLCLNGG